MRSVRLTWSQIALIAAASAFATVVVIHAAIRRDGVPAATLAALRQGVVVHRLPSPAASAQSAPPAGAQTGAASVVGGGLLPPSTPPVDDQATTSTSGTTDDGTDTGTDATTDTDTDTSAAATTPASTPAATSSPVKHVFVIALTTDSYRAAFGPGSVAHYLNGTLRRRGTLLSGYRTLGDTELPDYLAMISGQTPNADTRSDCA
ncbi:MAG: hypothetical protein ACLQA5_11510, partial [Solirubrobacteraceae bacterium]